MSTPLRRVLRTLVLVLTIALLTAGSAAAESDSQQATLFHTGPSVGNCLGQGLPNAPTGGFVNVHFNPDQTRLILNIHLRGGIPNETYYPSVRCVEGLAPFTTDNHGNGDATYQISSAGIAPGTFSIGVGNPVTDVFFTGPITIS